MASPSDFTPSEPPSVFLAGLLGRCPRCGRGPMFDGLLKPAARCTACGLDLGFVDAGDGPAVFAVFFAGLVTVAGALVLEFGLSPAPIVHVLVWVPVVIGLTIGMLRPLKGWLIALQFRKNAAEGRLADGANDRPA